jgi:hypothetical protein
VGCLSVGFVRESTHPSPDNQPHDEVGGNFFSLHTILMSMVAKIFIYMSLVKGGGNVTGKNKFPAKFMYPNLCQQFIPG